MTTGRHSGRAALAAITVVVWLLQFAAGTTRSLLDAMPGVDQWGMGARRLAVHALALLATVALYWLFSRTGRWSLAQRFAAALGLSFVGGLLYALGNELVFYVLFPVPEFAHSSPWWMRILLVVTLQSWTFLACLGAYLGLSYARQVRERELKLVRAEALAMDAQNRMLRQQINPHFLFNTLNALSTLVLQGRNTTAEETILSLARFMRRSLEVENTPFVTLSEEMDAEAEYLSIEQVRFGERLQVRWDVEVAARTALVPGLILQPIIENAVKYGVATTPRTVTIAIRARLEAGTLVVSVTDDGHGPQADTPGVGMGMGLENVRQRLLALYGAQAQAQWGPAGAQGFRVELRVPHRTGESEA